MRMPKCWRRRSTATRRSGHAPSSSRSRAWSMRSTAPSPASGWRRRRLGALSHLTRHAEESAEADAAAAHGFAARRIAGKPLEEVRDRDRALEPRQRHPGALMRAGAEGKMPVRRTPDIETLRIGELRGIAVGGADAQRYRRARRQRVAAEFDRLHRDAVAELVRAFEAQHFLDRGLDQARIFDQAGLLGRMVQ